MPSGSCSLCQSFKLRTFALTCKRWLLQNFFAGTQYGLIQCQTEPVYLSQYDLTKGIGPDRFRLRLTFTRTNTNQTKPPTKPNPKTTHPSLSKTVSFQWGTGAKEGGNLQASYGYNFLGLTQNFLEFFLVKKQLIFD